MKVTLTLTNHSKKLVQLDFPTSQRVEVLLKTKDGKTIETWSQDQAFTSEPTLVTINPNERLEYSVDVSTRDMVARTDVHRGSVLPEFRPTAQKLHHGLGEVGERAGGHAEAGRQRFGKRRDASTGHKVATNCPAHWNKHAPQIARF